MPARSISYQAETAKCANPRCGNYFALDAFQRSRLNRGIIKNAYCSTGCSRTRGQSVLLWSCANPGCSNKFLMNASNASNPSIAHCCSATCANKVRSLKLETRQMDVPRRAVCSGCGKEFTLSRQKRFNYEQSGQRNFFCDRDCFVKRVK